MAVLIGVVGFFGAVFFLFLLVINTITKKPKKNLLIGLGVCFALFITGLVTTPSSSDADLEAQSKQEIEVSNAGKNIEEEISIDGLSDAEKDLLKKSYSEFTSTERTDYASLLQSFSDFSIEIQNEFRTDIERLESEKTAWIEEQKEIENKPENRKKAIESAIKARFNDGDYKKVELDSIRINDDLGKDNQNYYIALVDFTFDVKNTRNTGNEVMRMYSDDLAATLAKKGITDISEIVVFWEDEYNNRSLKYAYEYTNGAFYVSDIAGE